MIKIFGYDLKIEKGGVLIFDYNRTCEPRIVENICNYLVAEGFIRAGLTRCAIIRNKFIKAF